MQEAPDGGTDPGSEGEVAEPRSYRGPHRRPDQYVAAQAVP